MDAPLGSLGTQTFIAGLIADATHNDRALGDQRGHGWPGIRYIYRKGAGPVTVVILENPASHKDATAAKAVRDAGCWFLYLPPYSPDSNPIEMAFSKLKALLRRIGARTFTEMIDTITQI